MDLGTLSEAYKQRISILHGYIEPTIKRKPQTASVKTVSKVASGTVIQPENPNLLSELAMLAKKQQLDIVNLLKDHISITEVAT